MRDDTTFLVELYRMTLPQISHLLHRPYFCIHYPFFRSRNNLRLSILYFFQCLLENPTLHSSREYAAASAAFTPILLSLVCATSVETPAVSNLSSFDGFDTRQLRLVFRCLAALAIYPIRFSLFRCFAFFHSFCLSFTITVTIAAAPFRFRFLFLSIFLLRFRVGLMNRSFIYLSD